MENDDLPIDAVERVREKSTMRFCRWIFILLFLTICWYGMLAVHELGHILAAWSSGATVVSVVLLPISQTQTSNVEYPLFVYGAGAVVGTVLPVLLWLIACWFRWRTAYLFRFFAGFCLAANGAYIGVDFHETGPTDAGLLIEHGASRWILVLFSVLCVPSGLFLWHGQSQCFFPKQPTEDS
ncbi:MAG: hypothetical protein FWE67_09365 [Planctomycetaceae bacterium]|nr:hypothetical protein [Planctomycetaceae bacterium]